MRTGLLAIAAVLVAAPTAHAFPRVAVTAGGVTVSPSFIAGTVNHHDTGMVSVEDGFGGINPPSLVGHGGPR